MDYRLNSWIAKDRRDIHGLLCFQIVRSTELRCGQANGRDVDLHDHADERRPQ